MLKHSINIAILLAPASVVCCDTSKLRERELNNSVFEVSNRLKNCLVPENRICSKPDKEGISMCRMKTGLLTPAGLPTIRIAKARVHAPVEEVSAMWMAHGSRKKWDITAVDSRIVREYNSETSLVYSRGRAGYICPARDFAFHICRVPGGMVGLRDFMSVAFINVDASADLPQSPSAVRGKQNSILLLQPVNAEVTDVTYVVEVQAGGWVPSFIAEYFGDNLVKTLRGMKVELEASVELEGAGASVEEVARIRFKRHLAQQEGNISATAMSDMTVNVDDLKAVRTAMEKKLKDIQKAKSPDFAELEGRVKKDIAQISAQIRQAEHSGLSSNYQSPKWGSTSK